MSIQICDYKLPSGDRSKQRESLINCFLKERAGTGKGDYASRYQYNVEIYGEYGIYLKRPTQLNKGFDFTVNVKGMQFKKKRKYSNPSHNDINNLWKAVKETIRMNIFISNRQFAQYMNVKILIYPILMHFTLILIIKSIQFKLLF